MSFSWKTQILLLTWIILCALVISCKPKGTPTTREKAQSGVSEGSVKMEKKTLSKEQIIAAATVVVRRHGENPEEYRVIYDEGNAIWIDAASKIPLPMPAELEGHDYQLVIYRLRVSQPGGELWVIVDRNTGEELWFARRG